MGINHRVKQMKEKMTAMQHTMDANVAAVKEVEHKVEKLDSAIQEKDESVKKLVKDSEFSIYDEMREREARRLNVVFHGVGEKESEEGDTGKDRAAWDRKSCENIFQALDLDISEDSVKFCRRLGEKGDEPRPLLAGFYTEMERSKLLRKAKDLEKTVFSNVNVGPASRRSRGTRRRRCGMRQRVGMKSLRMRTGQKTCSGWWWAPGEKNA